MDELGQPRGGRGLEPLQSTFKCISPRPSIRAWGGEGHSLATEGARELKESLGEWGSEEGKLPGRAGLAEGR